MVYREMQMVRLLTPLKTPDGVVPIGTEATVLHVFNSGEAYQVEFEGDHRVPETVLAGAVAFLRVLC